MIRHRLAVLGWLLVAVAALPVQAVEYWHADVDRLLQSGQAPAGVVFELLSWDEKSWQWAAPMITALREQLKAGFPDIDIAIVSHGGEQFQLTRERQQDQPRAIAQLASPAGAGVSVHVCGTHSSWRDVPQSAYLDFVDVSPSAPAQLNDYINLGYHHIQLHKP